MKKNSHFRLNKDKNIKFDRIEKIVKCKDEYIINNINSIFQKKKKIYL